MTLYLIGIGGTGAKCIESTLQLAAVGLFDEQPIRVLFIDADETNGNLTRARQSLTTYQTAYQLSLKEPAKYPWMRTPVESYGVWSPFDDVDTDKQLGAFFQYNSLKANKDNEALAGLFNVLYTQEERETALDVGFRGRPAIGAAIMSQVGIEKFEKQPWKSLIEDIKADAGGGETARVFLCGSIFGGTGAAGLPTIGRLISDQLKRENQREKVKIAGLFMLPYFNFAPTSVGETEAEVYARSEKFLLNTEAALRYYNKQSRECFDHIYLLGNQNLSPVEFSVGKNTQRNQPHFLEIYGALAIREFELASDIKSGQVGIMARQATDNLNWDDLQNSKIKGELVTATRFAYIWLSNIEPELQTAKDKGVGSFQRRAPWFTDFFKPERGGMNRFFKSESESLPEFDESEQEKMQSITDWCQDYLRWLSEIHDCERDSIRLFNVSSFKNPNQPPREGQLSDLIVDDRREQNRKQRDKIDRLKEKLDPKSLNAPNEGAVGLAKALYCVCSLEN
jgi:hypothetical protein